VLVAHRDPFQPISSLLWAFFAERLQSLATEKKTNQGDPIQICYLFSFFLTVHEKIGFFHPRQLGSIVSFDNFCDFIFSLSSLAISLTVRKKIDTKKDQKSFIARFASPFCL
jgi:hypothetical protein